MLLNQKQSINSLLKFSYKSFTFSNFPAIFNFYPVLGHLLTFQHLCLFCLILQFIFLMPSAIFWSVKSRVKKYLTILSWSSANLSWNFYTFKRFVAVARFTYGSPQGCGGKIDVTNSKTIQSYDANNDGLYEPELNCQWLLTGRPGQVLKMTFNTFDIEKGTFINHVDSDSSGFSIFLFLPIAAFFNQVFTMYTYLIF